MELKSIGIIHSPYKNKSDAPRQGRLRDELFEIEIFPEFTEGLCDVEGATHLIIMFWCDRGKREVLTVLPPGAESHHGVFATRSPDRPNPIALDIVDLVKRENNRIWVRKMDALDGSPLLDIKPYLGDLDSFPEAKLEWFSNDKHD